MVDAVEAVHVERGIALLGSGTVVPITTWFRLGGEECDSDEAVSCVAGSDEEGWFAIDLSEFGRVTMQ